MINLGIFAYIGTANAAYNLNDAVADTAETRNYILSEDENVGTTLGAMGGTNATLTIDGSTSNYGINADQEAPAAVGGITVGAGNTLILQNLGSYTVDGEGTEVDDYTVNSSVNGFVSADGGFIDNNGGTVTISDAVFNNNTAIDGSGGGGAIYNYSGEITTISNVTFIGNKTTGGNGGAISNLRNLSVSYGGNIGEIKNTNFINNEVTGGNVYGGAINNTRSSIGDISGKFIGNKVNATMTTYGMIYNTESSIGNINADFIGNSTINTESGYEVGGGVIYSDCGSTIKDITGNFKNNTFSSPYYILGSVIANIQSEIGDISANFIGNTATSTSTSLPIYGMIYNAYSEIGDITGDFKDNTSTSSHRIYGGILNAGDINKIEGSTFDNNTMEGAKGVFGVAISNYGGTFTEGITDAKFLNNKATSTAGFVNGGVIWNNGNLNTLTGAEFENNTTTAGTYAYGSAIYSSGTIANGIADTIFKNNTITAGTYAYGGAIYTKTSPLAITNVEFNGNIATASNNQAFGGAIYSSGSVLTLINTSFNDNAAVITNGTTAAGGAVFTSSDLTIKAKDEGKSVFKGNYIQVGDGDKNYQAIVMNSPTATLTLEATTDGVIEMYDKIDGWEGYTTHLTGDASGTINLYNDIIDSNVTTDTVNVSTADGTLHDYSMLSLNSDAAVKWKIDVDTKNQMADTIATDANAATASDGTITLNELNYVDSSTADIVDGFKVQILKTQGSPEAANLQLALSDDLSDEFVISQTEEVVTDEVTADTKWSDVFNKTTTATTTSGQFALATTDTLNDSISATVTTATEKTVEKLGDTLALVNKAELNDKSFTADTADEVYTLEDDLGDTYGNLTIRGVAESEQKSTVDLNGHDSFTVPEGASLTLIDVNLKGDAPLSNAGYADFYNAEVEGEVDNSGILTARESKLTTLVNNEEARLIGGSADEVNNSGTFTAENTELGTVTNENEATITGGSADEVNNSGTFTAEDAELGTFVNDGDAILTNGSANEVISNGVLETLDTEIVTLINNGYAELNGGYVGDTLNEDELTAKDAILGALSNNGEATLISSSADDVINNNTLTAEDTVIATLTNEGEATLIDSSADDVTNNNILTAENTYMTTFTNDDEATLIGSTADNIINNGIVDLTDTDFTSIDGNDGVVNMFSDVDLSGKKVSNNMLALQGTKATVAADSFGDGVVLVAESGAEVDIGNNKVSVKQATFDKDSQLTLKIDGLNNYGALTSDGFDIIEGAKLSAILGQNPLDGALKGEMTLLSMNDGSDINNNNFTDEFNNNMYTFKRKSAKSGVYEVYQAKTAEQISRENGGTKTNQGAAAAWVDGDSFAGGAAAVMADSLAELAQTDGVGFNKALTAIAPNDDGMVQAVTADLSDRLLLTIDNHLADSAQEQGLASGDKGKTRGYPDLSGVSTWAKGYYGKSKLQRRADIYGFDADSSGIIAGVDKKITSSIKAGLGMQYDDSDIDAYNRDVEAKTTLGFVYGEYRPSNWFVNGMFGYGVTDYDEDKSAAGQKVAAHYKTEIYSAQGLAGYSFKYFTPEIGARYYKIKRHGYVDGIGQEVSGENMDLLRTMAGVKAHADYGMFKPNAYFGMVYDVVSDRDNAIVNLSNGASYTVHGKHLPRFGVELGVGVTAQVTSKLELTIGYEAKFRKDYQDHSGTAVLKYSF